MKQKTINILDIMKSRKTFLCIALTILLSGIFTACQKNREEIRESIQSAEDNALIETEFTAVFEASDDVASLAADNKSGYTGKDAVSTVLPGGALIVWKDSLWNDGDGLIFYIDFGPPGANPPKGILCKDGRYRAGKIDVSLTKPWLETGSVLTITLPEANEYFVGNGTDMAQITGTKIVTRTSETSRHIEVTNARAVLENGTIHWNADRTVSKTFDNGPGLWGDEFTVYGNVNGTNINGVDFTGTVEEINPLVKKLQLGCASTFVSGVVTLENENGGVLILDYDPYNDQACDKVARVTINNFTRIVFVR